MANIGIVGPWRQKNPQAPSQKETVLVGIPGITSATEQANIRKEIEAAQKRISERIEVIFFEDRGDKANLEHVSKLARASGAAMGVPVRRGITADEFINELRAGFMDEVSSSLFKLVNADIATLDETRERLSNMTDKEREAIVRRFERVIPRIASEEMATMSLYSMNIRMRTAVHSYASHHRLDAAFADESRESDLKIAVVHSAAEVKPLVEAHRGKKGFLGVALIPTEEEAKKGITKEGILRSEEIDDMPGSMELMIVDKSMTLAHLKDIFAGTAAEKTGRAVGRIAMADRSDDSRTANDIPQGVTFLEYEDFAGPHVYYALCEAVTKPEDTDHLTIEWLAKKGWFRVIKRVDLEQLRREIEQYEKVLVAA